MKKITPDQRKKIYATAREIGMDNDLLHSVVKKLTGHEHTSDLSIAQAAKVIDHISKTESHRQRSVNLATGRKVAMASEKQMWKIKDLAKKLGWNDPKRLRGFCKKYAGVDNPDWMTKEQAWRIIEGLKSLLKQAKTSGGDGNGEHTGTNLDK